MKTLVFGIIVGAMAATAEELPFTPGTQSELEYILGEGFEPQDYFPDGEPPYVPLRFRNSLPEFQRFIGRNGWTTNQFLEGMMRAMTNNATEANWADRHKREVAEVAAWKLGEINDPRPHRQSQIQGHFSHEGQDAQRRRGDGAGRPSGGRRLSVRMQRGDSRVSGRESQAF